MAVISYSDILRDIAYYEIAGGAFFSEHMVTESVLCSIKRIGLNGLSTFVVNE